MTAVAVTRKLWLAAMLLALFLALALFNGDPSSEVVGNMAFALLVLCLPLSIAAYPAAIAVTSLLEPYGLLPYNSRLALTLWWAVFFLFGAAQWFLVPLMWRRLRPNKALQATREDARA
jgi:hypothetical protein